MSDDIGAADRLRDALQLKAKAIQEAEKALDRLREQRRALILVARGTLSYVEMSKAAGVSKPQVYKIVRDGFNEPPLRQQAEELAAASA